MNTAQSFVALILEASFNIR
uniref:Uncharacterized protein n=1 Tax=Arundo donax TaxID=35708 RepID=A0A0A8ZGE7_ARUDO